MSDEYRWEASLSHLSRVATENRSRATARWVASHARPERRHRPPGETGLRRKQLRLARKSLAGRYYQLLSGHAAIGPFLHERMTGAQRLESGGCLWCNCSRRQSRHRLFVEYKAWAPQVRRLWRRIGKDCGWEHPRAPAVRWLWDKRATGAMLEFLEDTRVGCRTPARAMLGPQRQEEEEGRENQGEEGEEGGRAHPRLCFPLSFPLLISSFPLFGG